VTWLRLMQAEAENARLEAEVRHYLNRCQEAYLAIGEIYRHGEAEPVVVELIARKHGILGEMATLGE